MSRAVNLGDDPRWSLGDGTDGFSVLADGLGLGVSVERGDELGHLLVALRRRHGPGPERSPPRYADRSSTTPGPRRLHRTGAGGGTASLLDVVWATNRGDGECNIAVNERRVGTADARLDSHRRRNDAGPPFRLRNALAVSSSDGDRTALAPGPSGTTWRGTTSVHT